MSCNITTLLKSGLVDRFHTVLSAIHQNVSAHSWGVAVIYSDLASQPGEPGVKAEGLMTALLHDCAELFMGDVPAHVKWNNPELDIILKMVESKIEKENGIDVWSDKCDKRTRELIKTADMLELIWWSDQQVRQGNSNYGLPRDRGIEYLANKGLTTARVHQIISEITGGNHG